MNILNLPTAEQFDVQNVLLASIASNMGEGGIDIKNWGDVQRITRMGIAGKALTVGDQFLTPFDGTQHVVTLIGIDHDKPSDPRFEHCLTFQFQDCLMNGTVSAAQALYKVKDDSLFAGTYHVEISETKYQFTTTKDVPVGGIITFPWAYDTDILTTKPKTFDSQASTTALETLTILTGDGGTELTELNNINKCRYGSNNYMESAIKQWLNSDADTWAWESQTDYDRPSTYKTKGFLKYLDPELVAVIGAVDKQVARNAVTDGGGQDTFSDKIFLLSQVELFGGTSNAGNVTGEKPYPYYSALAAKATTDELPGRIKLLNNSPQYYWSRSPSAGNSSGVRDVFVSGAVSSNGAYNAYGLSPAFCIY